MDPTLDLSLLESRTETGLGSFHNSTNVSIGLVGLGLALISGTEKVYDFELLLLLILLLLLLDGFLEDISITLFSGVSEKHDTNIQLLFIQDEMHIVTIVMKLRQDCFDIVIVFST